jgi:hypothetical protein
MESREVTAVGSSDAETIQRLLNESPEEKAKREVVELENHIRESLDRPLKYRE